MQKRNYEKEIVSRLEKIKGIYELQDIGEAIYPEKKYKMYCVIAKSRDASAKNIYLSASHHGNEPCAVYALLDFLEKDIMPYLKRFSFYIFPCLNPGGFESDTRNNPNNQNLNKNFLDPKFEQETELLAKHLQKLNKRYIVAITMHEDPFDEAVDGYPAESNPQDFYLYELNQDKEKKQGHNILDALEQKGIGVCRWDKIYFNDAEKGLIYSQGGADPNYKDMASLEGYMQRYSSHIFTFETPTIWTTERRIEVQLEALKQILDRV